MLQSGPTTATCHLIIATKWYENPCRYIRSNISGWSCIVAFQRRFSNFTAFEKQVFATMLGTQGSGTYDFSDCLLVKAISRFSWNQSLQIFDIRPPGRTTLIIDRALRSRAGDIQGQRLSGTKTSL